MPTFENRESLSSVRQKLNDAILLAEATSVDLETEKGLAQLAAAQAQGYANAAQAAATAAEAVEVEVDAAITAASEAAISATSANASAIGAATSASISSSKALEAYAYANAAEESATQAETSAAIAENYSDNAFNQASIATTKAEEAAADRVQTGLDRTAAGASAASALSSASTATEKASEASASKDLSQAWAEGTLPGGAGTKSSREWAEAAEASADRVDLGALDAAVAAAQAAAATIPAPAGNALKYSRVNAAETAYEARTPAQVLVDIGAAASGANSDISSLAGLTTPLSVAQGGTGSATASGARASIGAAASGVNNDITSLSGLTTPLSVAQGGTGANDAAGARTKIGAAAAGANSDITSLDGLTTALSVEQGGTGATTPAAARSNIGAAAAGANSDITALSGLTTPLSVAQGGTGSNTAAGALSNLGLTIPASVINRGPDQENRIINGAFDHWQRGTSFSTFVYGADRWINWVEGGTVTMSMQSFALGDTLGSNNPTYFLRQTVSGQTLASNRSRVRQNIESVRSYAGQTITVLGWARRSSGSGNLAVSAEQSFGTGGSPSGSVFDISPTTVSLTNSWQPFAVVMSIPAISGKTLGTNGNDYISINFWTSAGSNFNAATNSLGLQTIGVDFWGVHIKVGTHTTGAASLYRQPEFGPELARCQRYYETGPVFMTTYQGAASGFGYARPIYPKRVPPAVTFSGVYYINASGINAQSTGTSHVIVTAVATAAGAVNYNATAAFDAEL